MPTTPRPRTASPPRAAALAVALLLAALIAYAFLWPRAAWLLVPAADRAIVERALAGTDASFGGTTVEDWRWMARPVVIRAPGRVCVVIETHRSAAFHGRSGYRACYDERTGEVLEERSWL